MSMNLAAALLSALFSVLVPQKTWVAPDQALNITIKADKPVTLVLVDFTGKPIVTKAVPEASATVQPGQTVDLKKIWPSFDTPATAVLYAVPADAKLDADAAPEQFVGTPVVIEALADRRGGDAGTVQVYHLLPLQYAIMHTAAGDITQAFYYDVAPHTVDSYLGLASGGYYDGLLFHRVIPGFMIQGGDPMGTGRGGPGYHVDAEFSSRTHQTGVLSMARSGNKTSGFNTAGSQFFICLEYNSNTQSLDNQYTAFGKVTHGMDAVKKIATVKRDENDRPLDPQKITSVEVLPVTPEHDPYPALWTWLNAQPPAAPPTRN